MVMAMAVGGIDAPGYSMLSRVKQRGWSLELVGEITSQQFTEKASLAACDAMNLKSQYWYTGLFTISARRIRRTTANSSRRWDV